MSKFRCTCGHVVVDNGRFDHVKGLILRAQSFEIAYAQPTSTVAEFIRAVSEGKRKEWIERFYGRPYFEISDSSVVFDIMNYAHGGCGLVVYQCESCGRIYIEREPYQSSGSLRCFTPEDTDWRGTLAVELPLESPAVTVSAQPPPRSRWRFW